MEPEEKKLRIQALDEAIAAYDSTHPKSKIELINKSSTLLVLLQIREEIEKA